MLMVKKNAFQTQLKRSKLKTKVSEIVNLSSELNNLKNTNPHSTFYKVLNEEKDYQIKALQLENQNLQAKYKLEKQFSDILECENFILNQSYKLNNALKENKELLNKQSELKEVQTKNLTDKDELVTKMGINY